MRSGTVPHTLAVGLGAACYVAGQEMEVGVDVVCQTVWSLVTLSIHL